MELIIATEIERAADKIADWSFIHIAALLGHEHVLHKMLLLEPSSETLSDISSWQPRPKPRASLVAVPLVTPG